MLVFSDKTTNTTRNGPRNDYSVKPPSRWTYKLENIHVFSPASHSRVHSLKLQSLRLSFNEVPRWSKGHNPSVHNPPSDKPDLSGIRRYQDVAAGG